MDVRNHKIAAKRAYYARVFSRRCREKRLWTPTISAWTSRAYVEELRQAYLLVTGDSVPSTPQELLCKLLEEGTKRSQNPVNDGKKERKTKRSFEPKPLRHKPFQGLNRFCRENGVTLR